MKTKRTPCLFAVMALLISLGGACIVCGQTTQPAGANRGKTVYRGFTISNMDRETLEDAAKNWHANQVRYMMCPDWGRKPGETRQQRWKRLLATVEPGLDIAKELGLAVVLDLHQIPNDNPAPIPPNPDPEKNPHWDSIHSSKDESYLRVMIDCWRDLAEICKDRDQVIWFDLLNEPLEWSVIHIYPHYAPQWPEWAQKTINEIRKIDRKHPIVIEPGPGMNCWGFKAFPPLKDPCMDLIYSFHQYQPFEYTHQGVYALRKIMSYPGVTGDSGGGFWDAKRFEQEMAPAIEFQKKYGVRIYIGEFSVVRWAPDAERWLRDSLEFFEKHGWDWSYHSLREAYEWRLTEGEQACLVHIDKDGNRKGPFLAVPTLEMSEQGIEYWPWNTALPPGTDLKPDAQPTGMTKRGEVVLEYMKRNQRTVKKVLIIGNSITRHGPSPTIGWEHDWGMAATAKEKDFAHVLHRYLCQTQPGAGPVLELGMIANESKMEGSSHLATNDADLIVVELGDNFRGQASVEEFQKPYERLLVDLKNPGHNPRIICTSTWGRNAENGLIRAAAESQGAVYVDIRRLFDDPANKAGSEGHFTHDGVNWHPGDRGMKAIADTLWASIQPWLAQGQ